MVIHREYEPDDRVVPATYAPGTVTTSSMAWSPVQLVGLIVGVGFAVVGINAVSRTGFRTSHIYTPLTSVWHLPHTPLLAVMEIAYGALMILASVVPGGLRGLLGVLGAAALVLGIVVLAGPSHRLERWLAVNHTSGLLFTVVGAVVVLAAMLAPVFFSGAATQRYD